MCALYDKDQNGDPPGLDAFMAFLEEFKEESDRAAVILGIARLDSLLMQLVSRVLVPSTGNTDELLDGDAPLGSFSARIHAAYRLGLVSPDLARALHLCRKIRNAFAHESSGSSLNAGAHKDRVRELILPLTGNHAFEHFSETFFEEERSTRVDFRSTLAWISLRLEGALEKAQPLSTDNSRTLVD